jgi:hypothetical protein
LTTPPYQERELHLRDYLRVVYRRRWPALAVFVITAAVAIVRAYLAPPVYRATTRILIEKAEVQNIDANPYASWDPDFHRTPGPIIRSAASASAPPTRRFSQSASARRPDARCRIWPR